ncbi:unnamed protein product [Moneuplotes crassus]|uniref:START domain-containing protein n=1 Tax=Euplotes crassus TaxID=5936 RepID=A0AAD1XK41_EUPCR|nr:unnamed protein product [Moneuplotes crassus]
MLKHQIDGEEIEVEKADLICEDSLDLSQCDSSVPQDYSHEEVDELILRIKRNCFKGFFKKAGDQLGVLEDLIEKAKSEERKIPNDHTHFINSEEANRLRETREMLDQCLKSMIRFEEDWKLYKDGGDWKIFNKPDTFVRGSNGYEFGIETIIHSNYINPVVMINEIDLYKQWFPKVKGTEVKAKDGEFRKLVYQELEFPCPFSNRDLVMNVVGCILPEQNALCSICKSEESSWYGNNGPAPIDGIVRMKLHNSFSYLQILNDDETLLRVMINIDFKLKFVPDWLINYFIVPRLSEWIENIKDNCLNFKGTYYESRLHEGSVYRYIKSRLEKEEEDQPEDEGE